MELPIVMSVPTKVTDAMQRARNCPQRKGTQLSVVGIVVVTVLDGEEMRVLRVEMVTEVEAAILVGERLVRWLWERKDRDGKVADV